MKNVIAHRYSKRVRSEPAKDYMACIIYGILSHGHLMSGFCCNFCLVQGMREEGEKAEIYRKWQV